ncbi:acyltransferase [Chryseobacterium sp. JV558]|uniref:acyltransferase family protein n=1 Tax=Chryseobacterium sp. JV558 TaxID=2663236 RepID=UPI00299E78B7|nr:acyltransferase [Chryseobacterium sp. JV558]MDW9379089.1 acyltransferase family protein [Chryseobacterium sp. JV558]
MSAKTLPAQVPAKTNKLFYIDNLKIVLTILVILHHAIIAYCAPGGWYYTEKTTNMAAIVPATIFVSLNQSFFMGFFFLLSGYFTKPSYDRKGGLKFTGDRLMRLGIPLLFYSFILSPALGYMVYNFADGNHVTYLNYLSGYHTWIDFGVLWFVAALLLFTLLYVGARSLITIKFKNPMPTPGTTTILLFAVVLGIITFVVRVAFPVGWVLKPFGFQLGHFPQYISLFVIGLLAYKNQWFDSLSIKTGKKLRISAWLSLLFFPVFFLIRVKLNMPISWYSGGFHWQSLLYAVWEQWIGFSILISLLSLAKHSWNKSSPLLSKLSKSTFATYIFHPLVIVVLSLSIKNWSVDPAVKFLILAPTAVVASFLLASIILMIPGIKRVI